MTKRRNTVVCVFDHNAPKLSAYEVHEWIFDVLRLPEEQVLVIQIDRQQSKVYIKLTDHQVVVKLLQDMSGQFECKHSNGEITHVLFSEAGMGYRRVRVANLPPEEPENVLRAALAPYGKVLDIKEQAWTKTYMYVVASGIRQVTMTLTKHVPSNLMIKELGDSCHMRDSHQPVTAAEKQDICTMFAPTDGQYDKTHVPHPTPRTLWWQHLRQD
jgi:ribosomal protein S24E